VSGGRVTVRIDELVLEGGAGEAAGVRTAVEHELARYVAEHDVAPRSVAAEHVDAGTAGTSPAEIAAAVGRSLLR
jgi:hypothetical protein